MRSAGGGVLAKEGKKCVFKRRHAGQTKTLTFLLNLVTY